MIIISGGQTGADRGALIAAKQRGIATGGWMPRGFKAHDGHHPEFAALYGIREHTSPYYPPRTALNVKESDATIRIATDFSSSGEVLTLKMIKQYGKPHYDVDCFNTDPKAVADFILNNNVRILNVAGNSEKTSPGIQEFTVAFMLAVLDELDA